MRAAVTAAAEVTRANQTIATSQPGAGNNNGAGKPDTDSAFVSELYDKSNTYINICGVCFNVDVTTGPTQLEEANLTFMSKVQAIQNLHYCVGHIAPERL